MANLNDVARVAGLSPTAVSRHLNGHITLPEATRARIDAAVAELDYRPNQIARRLSTGRSEAISLVTPSIDNPFFAELAAAVEVAATEHGYAVSITSTRGDPVRELDAIQRLRDKQVDGLMLMIDCPQDPKGPVARAIETLNTVILLDEDIEGLNVPRIFANNTAGGYAATRHLVEQGHKDIAHISGPEGMFSVVRRYQGYCDALAEAGLPIGPRLFGEYTRDFGRSASREVLSKTTNSQRPTAIVTGSDAIAIGVLETAKDMGLSVPDDLSLTGFDDVTYAALLAPALTTIRQPVAQMGRLAFETLLGQMNGAPIPPTALLDVTLQIRDSTCPPKGHTT